MRKSLLWILATGLFLVGVALVAMTVPFLLRSSYVTPSVEQPLVAAESFDSTSGPAVAPAVHLPTPEPLKAIYMTACVAGTPSWRMSLKQFIEATELNAVVLDIKDSTGVISFVDEGLQPRSSIVKGCKVADLREFIAELHASDIYVIGRISVFQDPHYTSLHPELAVKSASTGGVWKDHKGLSFIDVGAKEYWDYIVSISKKSYELGFDELNFDYIRYPSDGNMQDVLYNFTSSTVVAATSTASTTSSTVRALTKAEMLESFFKHLHESLSGTGAVLSADLFGMVTTVENDMGIGQVLERALPYFDYIAPMVYPSHYPAGWHGFTKPAEHPYDVIKIAMTRAVEREQAWMVSRGIATSTPSKMRPWLQDFNLGATYDAAKIRAQIQATYDSGLTSWMLWSAANRYTESALLPH